MLPPNFAFTSNEAELCRFSATVPPSQNIILFRQILLNVKRGLKARKIRICLSLMCAVKMH